MLYRGELPRGEIAESIGTSQRTANRVVAGLIEQGVVASETPKAPLRAPLRITFPAKLAPRWMPGLFADASGAYRVIYTARVAEVVYVLHAFQKKTRATSKPDIEVARTRFAQLSRSQR